jgi:hypothetical protein
VSSLIHRAWIADAPIPLQDHTFRSLFAKSWPIFPAGPFDYDQKRVSSRDLATRLTIVPGSGRAAFTAHWATRAVARIEDRNCQKLDEANATESDCFILFLRIGFSRGADEQ